MSPGVPASTQPAWVDALDDEARAALRSGAPPLHPKAMLATLTDRRFDDPAWIFERKLDGERCLAVRRRGKVGLRSRNGEDLGPTYPEIADSLAAQPGGDFVVDGEVVAFEKGQTSFARLQKRLGVRNEAEARASPVAVFYYVFDVLHRDGYDVTDLELRTRKLLLRTTFDWQRPLRYTTHRNTNGVNAWKEACRRGWEGVIAKRADGRYEPRRSGDWLKFKCSRGQELVVGGFTDPMGSRTGFGALLLGYHDDGGLRYAGKVGTGFDDATLQRLRRQLDKLATSTKPFVDVVPERRVHWVLPELVAEIAFTEWTTAGRLRHPRFEGLRRDKKAADVVRES